MSSQAVAWAIVHKVGGPSAKAVLLSIANYADASGESWQDQQTLADGAECSVRQFRNILYGLIERGLVEQVRRGSATGGRRPNLIRLRMRELPVIISAKEPTVTECAKPAMHSNRQRLPETGLPAKIADRVSGNPALGNRQMIAGIIDNPTNPTTPLYPPGFLDAWALWPKHVRASCKKTSSHRWAKLPGSAEAKLTAVKAYLASPDGRKDGGAFVNAFEVWLNRKADFWLEQTAPERIDYAHALAIWDASDRTFWDAAKYGPAPNEPGYRGPSIEIKQERTHDR